MPKTERIGCACGELTLELTGLPILACECCCQSCRAAAERAGRLQPSAPMVNGHGGTHYVLYRKDRVRFTAGQTQLAGFRLTSDATARRVFAKCCNTPVFLELTNGHWLSLYAALWSRSGAPPQIEMRTMTMDLPDRGQLPSDVPNPKRWTVGFMARLLFAWVAMGFRVPEVAGPGELDV